MTPLQFAILQIGKQEIPKGSNWGEDVQKYLASVGIYFPASWCMAFVYWCFQQAAESQGVLNPLIRTGGVLYQWKQIKDKYKFSEPQQGDIFIMDFGNGLGHTGIIENTDPKIIGTIEGNTNDTGSREGYQVCRRKRKVSACVGFIRVPLNSNGVV